MKIGLGYARNVNDLTVTLQLSKMHLITKNKKKIRYGGLFSNWS